MGQNGIYVNIIYIKDKKFNLWKWNWFSIFYCGNRLLFIMEIRQFNTKNPTVWQQKRGVLNWRVCWTEGCVKLEGFWCWTDGFRVLNRCGPCVELMCWTEGYSRADKVRRSNTIPLMELIPNFVLIDLTLYKKYTHYRSNSKNFLWTSL